MLQYIFTIDVHLDKYYGDLSGIGIPGKFKLCCFLGSRPRVATNYADLMGTGIPTGLKTQCFSVRGRESVPNCVTLL